MTYKNTKETEGKAAVDLTRIVRRWWVSWMQRSEDHRPIAFPPNCAVLGWWCSGYDSDDNATLCALIVAEDEKVAEDVIKKEWPEWSEWRFIELCDNDFRLSDRFPLSDWMKARIETPNDLSAGTAGAAAHAESTGDVKSREAHEREREAPAVDQPRLVRRCGIELPLVFIKWVDSHYRSGWTTEAPETLPLKCMSVGWLVEDGENAKVLSAHLTSEDQPQRCGDMTIPTAAIISMEVIG